MAGEAVMKQVLLITDPGRDCDDTLALLALLNMQRNNCLRLVGVIGTGGTSILVALGQSPAPAA